MSAKKPPTPPAAPGAGGQTPPPAAPGAGGQTPPPPASDADEGAGASDLEALRQQLLAEVSAEANKIIAQASEQGRLIVQQAQDLAGQVMAATFEQVKMSTGQEKLAKEQVVNVQAALAGYPKVKVRFLSGSLEHEKKPIQFAFMGVPYTLARDVDHLLPLPVVKYHQANTTTTIVMDPSDPSGRKMMRKTVPSLPMQIVEWPDEAKG